MKLKGQDWKSILRIIVGCAVFALGFDLFLFPNGLNAGGISGLSTVFVHLTGFASVGAVTAVLNLPLFLVAGLKIGKRFFVLSLVGMALSSGLIDLFSLIPVPVTEPLMGSLYGGVLCGAGLGLVFAQGASTGGSDIVVRLLKRRWRNVPIGTIGFAFDLFVVALTGVVYGDVTMALYCGVAIYITSRVIDAFVYRFDYSKVVLVITPRYADVADAINRELERGVTYLSGEGYYSGNATKVVLAVVKKQQLAELKSLVVTIDPNAFIIVQEAHQVLGDGFSRYSKDSL